MMELLEFATSAQAEIHSTENMDARLRGNGDLTTCCKRRFFQMESVFNVLSQTTGARNLGHEELGFGRSAAIWSNQFDHVIYDRPEGHTLSLYLQGGDGTWRVDGQRRSGWAGALCLMPQGHISEWEITQPFRFVHLYLPDTEMRRLYAEMLDRDAREVSFPELTFAEDAQLAQGLRRLAEAVQGNDNLMAAEVMTELVALLFASPWSEGRSAQLVKGGLSSHIRRRAVDYLEAHLDAPIRLQELAELANLSEFHFQRMFRASLGVSPHDWLARRRVEQAKRLLRDGDDPIVQIAAACGFSSQSHLSRAFKDGTGQTPAAYRRAG